MYISMLRPKLTDEDLSALYWERYDHTRWEDHIFRVQKTIEFALLQTLVSHYDEVYDLSAGDATISKALVENPVLGDYTEGYQYQGKIEDTILQVPDWEPGHQRLLVLTETLEHLASPLKVLDVAAKKFSSVLLSTPIHEAGETDHNPEHLWCWDREGVEVFTRAAGFEPMAYDDFRHPDVGYKYGVWWLE